MTELTDWGIYDKDDSVDCLVAGIVEQCRQLVENDMGLHPVIHVGLVFDFRVVEKYPFNQYVLRGRIIDGSRTQEVELSGQTIRFLNESNSDHDDPIEIFGKAMAHDMVRLLTAGVMPA